MTLEVAKLTTLERPKGGQTNNSPAYISLKTPKNAFLETSSVLKGLKPLFFCRKWGFKKCPFLCPFLGGNTDWEKIVPTIQS